MATLVAAKTESWQTVLLGTDRGAWRVGGQASASPFLLLCKLTLQSQSQSQLSSSTHSSKATATGNGNGTSNPRPTLVSTSSQVHFPVCARLNANVRLSLSLSRRSSDTYTPPTYIHTYTIHCLACGSTLFLSPSPPCRQIISFFKHLDTFACYE